MLSALVADGPGIFGTVAATVPATAAAAAAAYRIGGKGAALGAGTASDWGVDLAGVLTSAGEETAADLTSWVVFLDTVFFGAMGLGG